MALTYLDLPEIQQWLELTKLTLVEADVTEFEQTAKELVFAKLSQVYDTSGWTSTASVPALIQKILSLYIAAWVYERAYSQDDLDTSGYAQWLLAMAQQLIEGIIAGAIDLVDVPGLPSTGRPLFYPNDQTGSVPTYDGLGVLIGIAGNEDIKFRVGDRY